MTQPGSDLLLDYMRRNNIPVTRENYIACAWTEPPTEWDEECEEMLPEELRHQDAHPER